MPSTVDVAKTFIATAKGKGIGDPISAADGWFAIRGYEGLTFNFKTTSLPQLRNEALETTLASGVKDKSPGLTQTLQAELSTSFIVRSALGTIEDFQKILLNGDNGDLTIDYYINTEDRTEIKYMGKLEFAGFTADEGIEFDTEGTTTVMSKNLSFYGHYFQGEYNDNPSARSAAIASINEVLQNLV